MGATREGGLKAAKKNKEKDPDFYVKIGRLGGLKSSGGYFKDKEMARYYGRIGGKKSRRKKDE